MTGPCAGLVPAMVSSVSLDAECPQGPSVKGLVLVLMVLRWWELHPVERWKIGSLKVG